LPPVDPISQANNVSLRDRERDLRRENARLRQALDAAKLTAEIERKRAEAAQEAAQRAWRIAGGYR
jgi:hypothetical protein